MLISVCDDGKGGVFYKSETGAGVQTTSPGAGHETTSRGRCTRGRLAIQIYLPVKSWVKLKTTLPSVNHIDASEETYFVIYCAILATPFWRNVM